jgi:hypothetical protein
MAMRFTFDAQAVEAGFVWLRDDGINDLIEVTKGWGSERKVAILSLPRRSPRDESLGGDHREALCRIAVAQFLRELGGATSMRATLDEGIQPWEGELVALPKK